VNSLTRFSLSTFLVLSSGLAYCQVHADHGSAHSAARSHQEQKAWGIAATATEATRTIHIGMGDDMRFTPDRIELRHGEVVKFTVTNSGKLLHELVIGTRRELDEHAAAMLKSTAMHHGDVTALHVSGGGTGELVWRFNRAGDFDFACLIPGHYQAGMKGSIHVAANEKEQGERHVR